MGRKVVSLYIAKTELDLQDENVIHIFLLGVVSNLEFFFYRLLVEQDQCIADTWSLST